MEADARAAGPRAQENQAFVGGGEEGGCWQAEAEVAIYPLSWPVASMAALIKVNGLRSGGADKPGFGLGHFGPRQDFLTAESRSMRGTPGRPDVPGLEPTAASLTSISNQKGDILYSVPPGGGGFWVLEAAFFSSEGKQPLPRQKLGTSTKGANVMSVSTKKPAILIEEAAEAKKVFSFGAAAKVL